MRYAIEQKLPAGWTRTGHNPTPDRMEVEWTARMIERAADRLGDPVICRIVEVA